MTRVLCWSPSCEYNFSIHPFPQLWLMKPCFQISGIMLHFCKFLATLDPFHLNFEASNFLNPGTSDFLNSTSIQVPSIWHSAIRNLLTHNDTSEAHQLLEISPMPANPWHYLRLPQWVMFIWHSHHSNLPTSEPVQSSDLQLPNSYWGIIDICCHSVGPSHMVVLRIPLWLTHYDFYYQQGIEQHFSSNPLLLQEGNALYQGRRMG